MIGAGKRAGRRGESIRRTVVRLACATFAVNSAFGPGLAAAQAQGPNPNSPPSFTNAQEVLALGLDAARQTPRTARIRGVVTLPVNGWIFVQDDTAGVTVLCTNAPVSLGAGQLVEVEGRVGAGLFTPILMDAGIRVLGPAPLPKPRRVSVTRMAEGGEFGQWVNVTGVVRDVASNADRLILFISSQGLRFHAIVEPHAQAGLPVEWLDATVDLQGVCWTDADREGRAMGFTLYVPGARFLEVTRPGSTNLLAQTPARTATRAELQRQSDDRLKVTGRVVFHSPRGVLYLETPEGPLQARLLVPLAKINPKGLYLDRPRITSLPAGTRVELVGAPTNSALAPILQDAEFRVVRQDPPPVAMPVSPVAALSGRFDRAPISLPARLLAQNRRHDGSPGDGLLLLQSGDVIFEGIWETSGVPALAPPPEARLQVSGVCLNEAGVTERARSFRLLLRAPSDVQVLGRLPPWASWPVGRILAVAGVLGLLALAWIGALRRRVRERTAALATANVRMSAEIEERKRAQSELDRALAAERELSELKSSFVSLISHEFRTPLGITMSAVELLRNYRERLTPAKLKELLDDIYAATLRMSGLMEQALLLGRVEAGKLTHRPGPIDLEIIAGRLVDETLSATQRQCPVQFHAENSLAGAQGDEGLLRHIFSNLLSNAVKYSPDGGEVRFTARRENGQAVFLVRDRGIGIPEADRARLFQAFHRASNVGQTPGTGLGLLIVKRCVELQGGTITYESRAGVGTEFTVRLPLFGPDR